MGKLTFMSAGYKSSTGFEKCGQPMMPSLPVALHRRSCAKSCLAAGRLGGEVAAVL